MPKINEVKQQQDKPNAWVTLVMLGDSYISGALITAYSLKRVNTKHEIVCMITKDVTEEGKAKLNCVFDRLIFVDYIFARCSSLKTPWQSKVYQSWINYSFTKWRFLSLTDYNRAIFLDADVVVIQNMDDLFDLPAPAATFSNAFGWPYGKSTKRRPKGPNDLPTGMFNPYYGIKHGEKVPADKIKKGLILNSFVACGTTILIKPSLDKFNEMLQLLKPYGESEEKSFFGYANCYSGHDEQFISILFINEWTMIGQEYNYIPWHANWLKEQGIGKTKFGRPKLFHYIMRKPWVTPATQYLDLDLFWDFVTHLLVSSFNNKKILDSTYDKKLIEVFNNKRSAAPIECIFCSIIAHAHISIDKQVSPHTFLDTKLDIQCPIYLDKEI